MLAGILIGAMVLAAPPVAPVTRERPTVAVVITGHEGLSYGEALDLARRLTRSLQSAGALAPMDPQAIADKLGARNPEMCGSRSACLAELAHAIHVSALVTLDGGRVVSDIALVVSLVDGRDGRKLLERSTASAPANVDATMAPLAAELARVASALPGPSALDAPFRSTRPDLERPPLNFGPPALLTGGGAVVAGGVSVGFLAAALAQWADLNARTHPRGDIPGYRYLIDYPVDEYDLRCREVDQRLTISLVAGISSAVLTGAAAYFLFQPPSPSSR